MDLSRYKQNRSWAEVDLDALIHNANEIRRVIGKRSMIMGVVKADAYGHGAIEVSKSLIEAGVNCLAVSMLDEAIQLRKEGINVPILVLNHTDAERANEIVEYDISQTVYSFDFAQAISAQAVKLGKNVKVHIKIDTGMSRVGFASGYVAISNILNIRKLENLIIEGLFTHFSVADEDDDLYTNMQFEAFTSVCNELARVGVHIPIKHVSNSAATMRFPQMNLDMVRPGIILYGLYPSEFCKEETNIELKPVLQIKSSVVLIKTLEQGKSVSYGRTYTTQNPGKFATIPIGYADGYLRSLSNKASVLINGERAPVVGRICMDQCVVDITNLKNKVEVGDEVVIIGKQGEQEISADEIAQLAGTINYEIVCLAGKRLPRFYMKGGEFVEVLNYLI